LLLVAAGRASAQMYILSVDSDELIGRTVVVQTEYEDTMLDIGRQFNVGFEELRLANPDVDAFLPGEGTSIKIPRGFVLPDAPQEGLVLNLPEMRLYYYPKSRSGEPVRVITHPVSIGRVGWETPRGLTHVAAKKVDPVWYPPESIRDEHAAEGRPLPKVVPAGPDNPLGRHAIRLGWPEYLIHGTNKPDGVGMRVSHGCIRMFPEDIEALYSQTPVGTPVRVVNQPIKAGWSGGTLFLEVHPAAAELKLDKTPDVNEALQRVIDAAPLGVTVTVDWAEVERVARARQGIPAPVGQRLDVYGKVPQGLEDRPSTGESDAVIESLW
jgi:L,D-transpeptidase ErfK/SrfK